MIDLYTLSSDQLADLLSSLGRTALSLETGMVLALRKTSGLV